VQDAGNTAATLAAQDSAYVSLCDPQGTGTSLVSPGSQAPCVLLTGLPRGGTTVACELLNLLPDVCALDEPMNVIAMIRDAGEAGSLDTDLIHAEIERFAVAQRRSILERGVAVTKHVNGRVIGAKVSDRRDGDTNGGAGGQGPRVRLVELGEIPVDPPSSPDFTLAIKHPVAFTALLPALLDRFDVFAIVRNPLAVMASWESVPMAVREGQLGLPASVAPDIADRLDAIDDRIERQLALLMWFYESYALNLPRERVIRYEDIVASGGAALAPIAPSAAALQVKLASRNAAAVYDRVHMREAARLLLEREGPHRLYYSAEDVRGAMAAAEVKTRGD
jgi:hypothetical protein